MMPPRWHIDGQGWLQGVAHHPSPHHDARPAGLPIDLLVVHSISLPAGHFGGGHIHALFAGTLDPTSAASFADLAGVRVASHFLIERDGTVSQFVSCDERAWHAGVSNFEGRERCNDFSIGIEFEGTDDSPFMPVQYRQARPLLAALLVKYPITAVLGHSDIAPQRKSDPGPFFDWDRLLAGIGRPLSRPAAVPPGP